MRLTKKNECRNCERHAKISQIRQCDASQFRNDFTREFFCFFFDFEKQKLKITQRTTFFSQQSWKSFRRYHQIRFVPGAMKKPINIIEFSLANFRNRKNGEGKKLFPIIRLITFRVNFVKSFYFFKAALKKTDKF